VTFRISNKCEQQFIIILLTLVKSNCIGVVLNNKFYSLIERLTEPILDTIFGRRMMESILFRCTLWIV
jgi:hypothetical protein